MRHRRPLLSLSVVILLAACVTQMPKTADEFRSQLQAHPNTMGVRIETFEVNGAAHRVAHTVKKKSDECLNKTVRITSRTTSGGFASVSNYLVKYEPRLQSSATKTTVYTTETITNLKGEPTQEPSFTFVADFIPTSKNKTKVELYYVWGEPRPLIAKAVKIWANGNDAGCPNLAKT